VRLTLDSNILVYALDTETPEKRDIARDLVVRAASSDAILTAQALAEYLAVIGRKYPQHFDVALAQAERWAVLFPVVPTSWTHVAAAAAFSRRHKLQLWDCVIWQAARSVGASIFLSEDLQDGLSLDGVRVLNPFKDRNRARLEQALAGQRPSTLV
jgi:predicted nucleic acid-binding protein